MCAKCAEATLRMSLEAAQVGEVHVAVVEALK